MVEFCEKCGCMMLPSKQREEKRLICNFCNFNKEIHHSPEEEFKNAEKIEG
ncbi:MAG: hypothetical protein ACFFG0_28215 [Candidatus Thorarchaeota archaeon]